MTAVKPLGGGNPLNALERLGRRRRERRDEQQPNAYPTFAVEACECLVDGPFALLRIAGTGLKPPAALVADGDTDESFEPLPQADDTPGAAWRVAFAIPAELAEPGTRLWLHDGGEFLVDVRVPAPNVGDEPRPAPRAPKPAQVAVVETEKPKPPRAPELDRASVEEQAATDPRARKLVEAWSEAATLREKLTDREAELAENLKDLLEARSALDPLHAKVDELESELAPMRAELELAHKQGREARLRVTEKAAELDAVRDELASAEPRVLEAERVAASAAEEAADLRERLERLEQALIIAKSDAEKAVHDAEERAEDTKREAEAARTRLTAEVEEQQQAAEELGTKLAKLEDGQSRRRGIGRRSDDRAVVKMRAELEAQLAEKAERIEQLESDAESFAERREDVVAHSLRERVAQLENEVGAQTGCNDDLRALLQSEREHVASARREIQDLKQQLATAKASRKVEADLESVTSEPVAAAEPARPAPDPPPWSALDDELLARIEKAKALTG
jgi:hypothetical protein